MFPSAILLSLLLVSVVSASPCQRNPAKVTLGFSHQINKLDGSKNLAEIDRARAAALIKDALSNGGTVKSSQVKNTGVTYTAKIGVGSPPTEYNLLIDTGSSNTFIKKKYVKTSTSKKTNGTVSVNYGSGSFSGYEYTDTVTLAPGLVVQSQSIGVANKSTGFDNVDGILGLGPVDLTSKTVSNEKFVPTVTDNLVKAGKIASDELGIFYVPATKSGGSGELTWGGVDTTKVTGTINYIPLTTTKPASTYWGYDQTVSYGNTTILSKTAGILDTGTTMCLLATDAFKKYEKATGAIHDPETGFLRINAAQYAQLKPLNFKIGTHTYTMSPNAQIWPRSLNSEINGLENFIYLIVGDLGNNSGQGLDFINGYAFLERFYSAYDTKNSRIGLATTAYTKATSN